MKKLSSIALLFFICFSLSAQYKKASFFGKEGRTYGLGTQLYAMGDGKGSPVGFAITFGRDRDGKYKLAVRAGLCKLPEEYKYSIVLFYKSGIDKPSASAGGSFFHITGIDL